MNNSKLKYLFVLMVSGLLALSSCADLSVDNLNNPTTEAVESDEANQVKLLAGGFFDASTAMVSDWGVHIHNLADQSTGTNAFNNYWDFSEEPRLRLDNTTSYSASTAISVYFGGFNSAIATANLFIANEELSDDIRAQAYFLRGLSRGYLGMIYDQSYFLDENFDATTDEAEFQPYTVLIDGALSDIDQAISLASGSSTFVFNSMPNPADSWTQAEFLDIANSIAARIAAGEARTASEAASLDWGRILAYAEAGLGGPNSQSSINTFSASNIGSSGEYTNDFVDWLNFVVTGTFDTGAGYNPTDVKIPHMLDPSYPVIYPAENASASEASYPPAVTDDPRIDYFKYTTNPGYLNPTRNANLFTNYFSARMFANSDWWPSQYKIIFMTSSEVDYLRAEAQLMSGSASAAAQTLNDSPAGTGLTDLDGFQLPAVQLGYIGQNSLSGGHFMDGSESLAEFQWALLREYSVELDMLGGVGIQWFFMRRHDMLQEGTATMFPVPGSELEILGLDNYTFGGPNFAGQTGSASGDNSWKNLAETAFGSSAVNLRVANSKAKKQGDYLLPVKNGGIPSPVSLGKKALNN
ncbi:hypothetical protein [Rhodohalobacter sp. 614A]|uniref:hypothetical protein n=1 Tax=Rhodohalobacter sp. 614A TaxID=2908649 RepID=UPI001F1FAF61|nr:hypothetical protein [Rhodohalobacter sp. 614A]